MGWTPQTKAGKALAIAAFIAGSLTAIVTFYRVMDFPRPAWSSDIERLEKQQLKGDIPTMEDRLDRFIIRRGQLESLPENQYYTREKRSLDRQIKNLDSDLEDLRDRLRELGP